MDIDPRPHDNPEGVTLKFVHDAEAYLDALMHGEDEPDGRRPIYDINAYFAAEERGEIDESMTRLAYDSERHELELAQYGVSETANRMARRRKATKWELIRDFLATDRGYLDERILPEVIHMPSGMCDQFDGSYEEAVAWLRAHPEHDCALVNQIFGFNTDTDSYQVPIMHFGSHNNAIKGFLNAGGSQSIGSYGCGFAWRIWKA